MYHRRVLPLLCLWIVAGLIGAPRADPADVSVVFEGLGHDMAYDDARGLVYVSVPLFDEIVIVSTATYAIVNRIAVGSRPHGVDLSLDGSRLFVALNGAGAVAILDLETLSVTQINVSAALGATAVWDVLEARPDRLYVTANAYPEVAHLVMIKLDQNDEVVTVAGGETVRRSPVLGVSPDQSFLYLAEHSDVYKLDLQQDTTPIVLHRTVGGSVLTGLEISPDGARIFLTNGKVLDAATLDPVGTVGEGIPRFGASDDAIFIGFWTQIKTYDTASFALVDQRPLPCAVTSPLEQMVVLPGDAGWLVLSDDLLCGTLMVGDCPHVPAMPSAPDPSAGESGLGPNVVLSWDPGPSGDCATRYDVLVDTVNPPEALACDAHSEPRCETAVNESEATYYWRVVARNPLGTTAGPVWSFDARAFEFSDVSVDLDGQGFAMVYDDARKRLYVSLHDSNELAVVSTMTYEVIDRVPVTEPRGVALSIDGSRVFVASRGTGTIAIVNADTLQVSHVDAFLGATETYDVIEARPDLLFASFDHYSSQLAMIRLDEQGGPVRGPVDGESATMEVSPDRRFLYVGESSTSGSISKLDLDQEGAPLVLEGDQFDIDDSKARFQVSPDGALIHLTNGLAYRSGSFNEAGSTSWGEPRFDQDGSRVFITRVPDLLHVFDVAEFLKIDEIQLPCTFTRMDDLVVLPDDSGWLVMGNEQICGLVIDVDGDGIAAAQDNCPRTPNADQSDADGDGKGDVCDNCPAYANATQEDTDGDGQGNACDPFPDHDLRARLVLQEFGLAGVPSLLGLRLEDRDGVLVPGVTGARVTLALSGLAVFGTTALEGVLVTGGGTQEVEVEFVDGRVTLPIEAAAAGTVSLSGSAAPGIELLMTSDVFEDFESDSGGFTHSGVNDSWELGVPTIQPGPSFTRAWGTSVHLEFPRNSDASLVSPRYPIPATGHPVLELRSHFYSDRHGTGDLDITQDDGATWSRLAVHVDTGPSSMVFPLSDYAGSSVQVRFRFVGREYEGYLATGWLIDDFTIRGLTPSIEFLDPFADDDLDGLDNDAETDLGTDPRSTDSDGDGTADGTDNCPATPNVTQADRIHPDGVGDACDDPDGDGIFDREENCPDTPNPDQANVDGDRFGDACDPYPGHTLRIRPIAPEVALIGQATPVTFVLEDRDNNPLPELVGVRAVLTVDGSATFGAAASEGLLLGGGGTQQAFVEFVGGHVTVDVTNAVIESVGFGGIDTEGLGIAFVADYVEDFEDHDGGFVERLDSTNYKSPGAAGSEPPVKTGVPGGDTNEGVIWQWGEPTSGPGSAHSGQKVWATNLDGDYPNNADVAVESPSFSFPPGSTPSLEFWSWADLASGDWGRVRISSDGWQSWDNVSVGSQPAGFALRSADLSAYAGLDVQIRFHFHSDTRYPAAGWYLDDFALRGLTVSTEFVDPAADPDLDGLTNAEELDLGSDPFVDDSDGDGIIDLWDNCPTTPNTNQVDVVRPDGVGDACDDPDADGVFDIEDNCPDTPNEDQANTDGDLRGDACDPYPDHTLQVRTAVPDYTLTGQLVAVTLRLEDWDGQFLPDASSVRASLTVDGSAVFGVAATEGLLLAGGGTNLAQVEFINGLVTLSIEDAVAEVVTLGIVDSEGIDIRMAPVVSEQFEVNSGWFSTSGSYVWMWGEINSGPGSAFSGNKAWSTNRNGTYYNSVTSILTTPSYSLPVNSIPVLEFQSWFDSSAGDFGWVQISSDGGVSWVVLQTFTGNLGGYSLVTQDLQAFAGLDVQLRFRFTSNAEGVRDGWYIDDFALVSYEQVTVLEAPADLDQDGVSNADEFAQGSDPGNPDTDLDGVGDATDNCPVIANADQADSVHVNGIGDACDDPDGDDVFDREDNCVDTNNVDQANTDSDALGDVCDPYPTQALRVRTAAPEFALMGDSVLLTMRLVNQNEALQSGLDGVRISLTADGSASFGTSAIRGLLIEGGGTDTVLVEFVNGQLELELTDAEAELVTIRGEDTEGNGAELSRRILEYFELGDDGGFTHSGQNDSWNLGNPVSSPYYAYSGENVWCTNLTGDYPNNSNASLISPAFRIAAVDPPVLEFHSWFNSAASDYGYVELSVDGGAIWTELDSLTGNLSLGVGYRAMSLPLPAPVGSAARVRFRLYSSPSTTRGGWCIDNFTIRNLLPSIEFMDPLLDQDYDGVSNFDEVAQGSNPRDPDSDADGLDDAGDNCPAAANPDQSDTLHPGGAGDACDDPDEDGLPDLRDNCIDVANPEQADLDRDFRGDVCDPYPDRALQVRPVLPAFALTGRPLSTTFLLQNRDGTLQTDLVGIQATLTLDGSAVFGGTASAGHVLAGGGTNQILAEFVDGLLSVEISDAAQEVVTLTVTDSDGFDVLASVEDFEYDDGGFYEVASTLNEIWEWGVPTSGPGFAAGGLRVWGTKLDGEYSDWLDSSLTLPPIAVPPLGWVLVFQNWMDSESCCDGGSIQISSNQGANWTTLDSFLGELGGYALTSVDLADYAGLDVQLRLRFFSDGYIEGAGWYVDEFALPGLTTSLEFLDPLDDADGDSLVNADEVDLGSDPHSADTDLDGVLDASDNCPRIPNADQSDNVHPDGVGDACDDPDMDGLPDDRDNCPDASNPDQTNSDPDIFGDACDAFPDRVLHVRVVVPQVALAGRPAPVALLLVDSEGALQTGIEGVQATLTADGSATFGDSASEGNLLSGGLTNEVVVQFVDGRIALDLRDPLAELVTLRIVDSAGIGITALADVFETFETNAGGFFEPAELPFGALDDGQPGGVSAPAFAALAPAPSAAPAAATAAFAPAPAVWEWGVPTAGPDDAYSGVRLWATNLDGDYPPGTDSSLVSPRYAIPSGGSPALEYVYWMELRSGAGYVEVSSDNGASWTTLQAHSSDQRWFRRMQLSLDAYAGSEIRVRFRLTTGSSTDFGWYIDNFKIYTQAVGLTFIAATDDFDADGLSNAEELSNGTDPYEVDSDNDAVPDATDNCPTVSNTFQEDDLHPNNLGDACDDPDADGVADSEDNCLDASNADQADMDTDTYGDVCDNCPAIDNIGQEDIDEDAVGDACDNCLVVPNPWQSDANDDLEGDVCDLNDGIHYIVFPESDLVSWDQEETAGTWNVYRGSVHVLRTFGTYTQAPGSNTLARRECDQASPFLPDSDLPDLGESMFYLVTSTNEGLEDGLGNDSSGLPRPNTEPCP